MDLITSNDRGDEDQIPTLRSESLENWDYFGHLSNWNRCVLEEKRRESNRVHLNWRGKKKDKTIIKAITPPSPSKVKPQKYIKNRALLKSKLPSPRESSNYYQDRKQKIVLERIKYKKYYTKEAFGKFELAEQKYRIAIYLNKFSNNDRRPSPVQSTEKSPAAQPTAKTIIYRKLEINQYSAYSHSSSTSIFRVKSAPRAQLIIVGADWAAEEQAASVAVNSKKIENVSIIEVTVPPLIKRNFHQSPSLSQVLFLMLVVVSLVSASGQASSAKYVKRTDFTFGPPSSSSNTNLIFTPPPASRPTASHAARGGEFDSSHTSSSSSHSSGQHSKSSKSSKSSKRAGGTLQPLLEDKGKGKKWKKDSSTDFESESDEEDDDSNRDYVEMTDDEEDFSNGSNFSKTASNKREFAIFPPADFDTPFVPKIPRSESAADRDCNYVPAIYEKWTTYFKSKVEDKEVDRQLKLLFAYFESRPLNSPRSLAHRSGHSPKEMILRRLGATLEVMGRNYAITMLEKELEMINVPLPTDQSPHHLYCAGKFEEDGLSL